MNDKRAGGVSSPGQSAPNPNVTSRLDRLPWCRFHTVVTIALALGWMLDAFETNVIGSVLGQVTKMWQLTPNQGSSLVSAWVLGMLVGAIVFGYFSDRLGRKKLFILTLVWYAGFSVVTAFSWNYDSLLAFRFLAALGVGGEYSAVTAAMVEFIPSKHRGKTAALVLAAFPVGGMISAVSVHEFLLIFPPNFGWRMGFGLGALLAGFGLWVRYAIPESPRWLAMNGQAAEAEKIVNRIEEIAVRQYGADLPPVVEIAHFRPHNQPGVGEQLKELFSRYLGRLLFVCSLNFAQASVVYGISAALSVVILPAVKVPAEQMPTFYFMGYLGSLAGSLLAAYLLDKIGRKVTILGGYVLVTLAVFNLYFASTPMAVMIGNIVLMFVLIGTSNSSYVVSSEVMPVNNRATGLGISVAVGRIGAFFAPIWMSTIYSQTHKAGWPLLILTAMTLPGPIAALVWYFKGIEANNRPLDEVSGESQ
ncbi:MAG TPA: MFS transporter [Verrucomicrobiae bacterium]|nr:MFS transporter [Verrucomicrobiae bacterium]